MRLQAPPRPGRQRQRGFTLVEIMVTIALLAIITSLAVPSWTQIRVRNALRAATNDFTSSLYLARAEAVRLNTRVTVCPSDDGANCTNTAFTQGWIVKTGTSDNEATQVILQDILPHEMVRMDATDATRRVFTFLPNGRPAANFAGATVQVCPDNTEFNPLTRQLVMNRPGRIRLESPGACSLS